MGSRRFLNGSRANPVPSRKASTKQVCLRLRPHGLYQFILLPFYQCSIVPGMKETGCKFQYPIVVVGLGADNKCLCCVHVISPECQNLFNMTLSSGGVVGNRHASPSVFKLIEPRHQW